MLFWSLLVWVRWPCILLLKFHTFWEGHKILRNLHCRFVLCSASQIYSGDFAKFCGLLKICELYLPRLLVPLPFLLWRLGLAWFGLQCQCWFAEIFPENDHSLVLLLTFAIFISLTYQNDCKTILIREFMLGMVKTNHCLYLLHNYFDLGNSRKCLLVFLLSFAISIYHVVSKWLQTILFEELMLGMKKKINLTLSPPLLLWLGEVWAEDSN